MSKSLQEMYDEFYKAIADKDFEAAGCIEDTIRDEHMARIKGEIHKLDVLKDMDHPRWRA